MCASGGFVSFKIISQKGPCESAPPSHDVSAAFFLTNSSIDVNGEDLKVVQISAPPFWDMNDGKPCQVADKVFAARLSAKFV